ncbi:hypothetical protein D9Q98_006482 [Chlorella vulgaris]|uniref:Protein kinase domain-containing protein n=1 Tax=Chlorella vulgaris TaxID=3077 RepID=A0A9D4YVA1_CHLVU|nr:hypothetical protein D9Q98_006482 [Chlorella vulgaris]
MLVVLLVVCAHAAVAAGSLPDGLLVLPADAYLPVTWTQWQVASMRRRALLQSASGSSRQLPVCELMLAFRPVDISTTNYSSVLTLTNNRDLDLAHWQLVWRFSDYRGVLLKRTDGAIQLSAGSVTGQPCRLVDTFQNDGIPGGGGTYSLLAEAAFVGQAWPPSAEQPLGIEAVNINGMQCSLVGGTSMHYSQCTTQPGGESPEEGGAVLSEADSAGSSSSGACWSNFCCGVVLAQPTHPPPQMPPPPPAPLPPLYPELLAPPPPPQQLAAPPPPEFVPVDLQAVDWPSPPVAAEADKPEGTSVALPAAAAGGGAAAVLLAVIVLLLARRRRRRSKPLPLPASESESQQDIPEAAADGDVAASRAATRPPPPQSYLLEGSPTLGSVLSPASALLRPLASLAEAAPADSAVLLAAGEEAGDACQVTIASAAVPAGSGSGNEAGGSKVGGRSARGSGGSVDLAQDVVLHEELGRGAFGTVYRGSWKGQPVAVKVLQTSCEVRSRELDSFKQEARVLAGLRHPNIVSLLAACTVPPNICIIEELAEGGSLHQRLHGTQGARRRSPLPYGQLLAVAADVAAAICYLHPRIVHRDLKSQNVLLDAQGRAKVCDFGIAKFKDRTFVSTVGAQAGTPAYMAPEMFDGAPVSEKVDSYSYAVLCWEMLTGQVPWQELQTPMQIIFQVGVMHQRLPFPDSCPAFLRQLIEDCWADEPSERPGFSLILQRLDEELARVAADVALRERRTVCRSTVSETDASSAAGGLSRAEASLAGNSGGREMAGADALASPFDGHPLAFTSSSDSSSRGGLGAA